MLSASGCKPVGNTAGGGLRHHPMDDALVFPTPALKDDIELTGRLIVKLWAASG